MSPESLGMNEALRKRLDPNTCFICLEDLLDEVLGTAPRPLLLAAKVAEHFVQRSGLDLIEVFFSLQAVANTPGLIHVPYVRPRSTWTSWRTGVLPQCAQRSCKSDAGDDAEAAPTAKGGATASEYMWK